MIHFALLIVSAYIIGVFCICMIPILFYVTGLVWRCVTFPARAFRKIQSDSDAKKATILVAGMGFLIYLGLVFTSH